MTRRRLKTILTLSLLGAILAGLLFSAYATATDAPAWLRMVGVEIQAACRDAGTQWMVVACLASYFVTFLFLERRILPRKNAENTETETGGQKSEKKAADSTPHPGPLPVRGGEGGENAKEKTVPRTSDFRPLTSISAFLAFFRGKNADVLLIAFIALVLLRYAMDYSAAARSLQVVVLLAGMVFGKGIALWVAWAKRPTPINREQASNAQLSTSKETESRHLTLSFSPLSGDTSSGCATFSPSDAEKGIEAERGAVLSTIHPQLTTHTQPSTINKARAILSIIVFLLACAALWQPERGMEFQYRGQRRWTGAWDNPNLYGVLMGTGLVLAVGLLGFGKRPTSNAQHPTSKEVGRVTPCAPGMEVAEHSTFNFQPSTINAAHWFCLTSYFCAAALCAYGLVKSYSRGAWLGAAVGMGVLIWKWINREPCEIRESRNQSDSPLPTFGHPLPVRRGEGRGEGGGVPTSCFSRIWRISRLSGNWFPSSILLLSILVICFWQFQHTESPLLRRIFSVGNPNDFSWRNRVTAWQGAGRMMWDKPLVGFGWGKAEEIYSKEYRAARLEETAAIQMNDFLMLGISAGTPALACLLAYLGIVLSRRNGEVRHLTPSLSLVEAERESALSTINCQLSTITASGAAVLLIGFWFDGGLFKLATGAVFWVLVELCRRRGDESFPRSTPDVVPYNQLSTINQLSTLSLRWLAGIFAVAAFGLTALHLGTPQLAVSERTLNIARKFLVPPKEKADFEYLAGMYQLGITNPLSRSRDCVTTLSPSDGERDGVRGTTPRVVAYKSIWSNTPLKTLLQHAHLANYNRELVNWKLDDQIYREFVLSPQIGADQIPSPGLATTLPANSVAVDMSPRHLEDRQISADSRRRLQFKDRGVDDMSWRRFLWEYFYPRIRKENSLEAAAGIIVRQLRERVKITDTADAPKTIAEIWQRGSVNERGFEVIYVAALRSAGIPARLSTSGQAEFWTGAEWKPAPRPLEEQAKSNK